MGSSGGCYTDWAPCDGFSDGAGSFDRWVGMGSNQNFGQSHECGCGVACYPCADDATWLQIYYAHRGGRRWLRPSRTYHTHDSRGRFHSARSDNIEVPHRVPFNSHFDRAPCFTPFGSECFNEPHGLCECDTAPSCNPGPLCPSGTLCQGKFADTWWYNGYLWTPNPGPFISCRLTIDIDEFPISATAGALYQDVFLRSALSTYQNPNVLFGYHTRHCVSNKFVYCSAWVTDQTTCPSVWNPQLQETYNPDARHGQFHYLGVEFSQIRLKDQGLYSYCHGTPRVIKNAALAQIVENLPPQLEHKTYVVGNPAGNPYLDIWERSWVPLGETGIVLATYPDSYLRYSRCPVNVKAELVGAKVYVSLVAHSERAFSVPAGGGQIYDYLLPTVRVHIRGQIVYRAYLDGTCILNGQQVEIDNSVFNQSARVVGGVDEIIVVDEDGKSFDVPDSVEWWGYHGQSGKTPWTNRLLAQNYTSGGELQCCLLGRSLSGLQIHGWPTAIESRGQSQADSLYEGHITIDFSNQGSFTAVCPPPDGGGDGGGGFGPGPGGDFYGPRSDTTTPGPYEPREPELPPGRLDPPTAPFDPTQPPVGRGPYRPIGGPGQPFIPEPPVGGITQPGPFVPRQRIPPTDIPPGDVPFVPGGPIWPQPPIIAGPYPRLKPPKLPPVRPLPIPGRPVIQGPRPELPEPPDDNPPSPHDPVRPGDYPFGPTGPYGPTTPPFFNV